MTIDLPKRKLLNTNDLAARLGVSRQTIRNMLREGRCPVAPIEGTKPPRWSPVDVDALFGK